VTPRTASLGAFAALLVLSSVGGAAVGEGATRGSVPVDDCATADRAPVDEGSDPVVSLANDTVRVERGGTARITVEMNGTDTGYLRIGREWSSSSATVRLRDVDGDGAVTVWFDTFARIFDEHVVAASGTDEASLAGEMESYRAHLLGGEYEITTALDREAVPQNSSDRGTLHVTSGSTDGVRLWRLDGVGPNASSGAVESAISDRKFSQFTAFWPEGWLVVSVDVPGITEVVTDRPESTPTERFTGALADGNVRFHAARQESNVPQLPPMRLDVTKVLAEDALVVVPKQRTDGTTSR
jgi:hypothetical protein